MPRGRDRRHGGGTRGDGLPGQGRPLNHSSISASDSIGILYSIVTLHLGSDFDADEYKVIGLAPYGDPERFRAFFDEAVSLNEDRGSDIPLLRLQEPRGERERYTTSTASAGRAAVDRARALEDEITADHEDAAAALQACLGSGDPSCVRTLREAVRTAPPGPRGRRSAECDRQTRDSSSPAASMRSTFSRQPPMTIGARSSAAESIDARRGDQAPISRRRSSAPPWAQPGADRASRLRRSDQDHAARLAGEAAEAAEADRRWQRCHLVPRRIEGCDAARSAIAASSPTRTPRCVIGSTRWSSCASPSRPFAPAVSLEHVDHSVRRRAGHRASPT